MQSLYVVIDAGIAVRQGLNAIHRQKRLIIERADLKPVGVILACKLTVVLGTSVHPRVIATARYRQWHPTMPPDLNAYTHFSANIRKNPDRGNG